MGVSLINISVFKNTTLDFFN